MEMYLQQQIQLLQSYGKPLSFLAFPGDEPFLGAKDGQWVDEEGISPFIWHIRSARELKLKLE